MLTNTGVDSALLPTQSTPGINDATNRLIGFSYDTSGNTLGDGVGNSFSYDAENHQLTHTRAGTTTSYVYDGEGRRVKKESSGVTTVFVYNAGGQLIAEYTTDPVPPPAGGGGTSYLTTDHLGSTRLVTDQNRNVKSRRDYCPYGEELGSGIAGRTSAMGYSQADGLRQRFTQKERDLESGLDYFLARYYSGAQGRFISADPLGPWAMTEDEKAEFLTAPQRWNRYTYVTNNPLRYSDPDGFERYDRNVSDEDRKRIHDALVEISVYGNEEQQAIATAILSSDLTIGLVYGQSDTTIDADSAKTAIAVGAVSAGQVYDLVTIRVNKGILDTARDPQEGRRARAALQGELVHEGKHTNDFAALISVLWKGRAPTTSENLLYSE